MTTAQHPDRIRDYDDKDLVARLRTATGPEERDAVISEILRRYEAQLGQYCRRHFSDRRDGEDAAAVTRASIWQLLRDGKAVPQHLRSWVFSVARKRCLDHGRAIGKQRARNVYRLDAESLVWQDSSRLSLEEAALNRLCTSEGLIFAKAVLRAMPEDQQRLYQLHYVRRLSGARLGAELGCSPVQADSRAQRHRKALRAALEVNLLARDPDSRKPWNQLSKPPQDAPAPPSGNRCGTLTSILKEVMGEHPEIREILDDPKSTAALPHEACGPLKSHIKDCETCKANISRLVARLLPTFVALLGIEALTGGEQQGMQPVASVSSIDPPTPGHPAVKPPAHGWGRRPTAGRNLVVSALAALALWGGLSTGALTPGTDVDHLALLPPSLSAPRDQAPEEGGRPATGEGKEPAPAGPPADRPAAAGKPSPEKHSPTPPRPQPAADSPETPPTKAPTKAPAEEDKAEEPAPQAPTTPPTTSAGKQPQHGTAPTHLPTLPPDNAPHPPAKPYEPLPQPKPQAQPQHVTGHVKQEPPPRPSAAKEPATPPTAPSTHQGGPHSDIASRDPSVLTRNNGVHEPG
ncbi:sigma-70 family RNA polymerase sigma factor [Streptomyces sp. NPDC001678]|uniref:sigma-70 family RNA polymerase sigma factor n=1 Tax=Streptomyces sp. NPDC001678 TaxID=3364599 RepID=UPI003679F0E6